MSTKTILFKKIRREVRKTKKQMLNGLATEISALPLKEKIKLAIRVIFKGKL